MIPPGNPQFRPLIRDNEAPQAGLHPPFGDRVGQTRTATFTLDKDDVGFYDNSGRFVVEPGAIDVYAGDSSAAGLHDSFKVVTR